MYTVGVSLYWQQVSPKQGSGLQVCLQDAETADATWHVAVPPARPWQGPILPPGLHSSGESAPGFQGLQGGGTGCVGTALRKPARATRQGKDGGVVDTHPSSAAETISQLDHLLWRLLLPSATLVSVTYYFQRSGFYKTNIWISRFIIRPVPQRENTAVCAHHILHIYTQHINSHKHIAERKQCIKIV